MTPRRRCPAQLLGPLHPDAHSERAASQLLVENQQSLGRSMLTHHPPPAPITSPSTSQSTRTRCPLSNSISMMPWFLRRRAGAAVDDGSCASPGRGDGTISTGTSGATLPSSRLQSSFRDVRTRFKRRGNQQFLLHPRPPAPPLHRRDHLRPRYRHSATPRISPRTCDARKAALSGGILLCVRRVLCWPAFPWSLPFAPPAPRLAAQLCSAASLLLWRGPTSRVRDKESLTKVSQDDPTLMVGSSSSEG
jgi:hypothetical protein